MMSQPALQDYKGASGRHSAANRQIRRPALLLAVRLAAVLSRPVNHLHPSVCALDPLPISVVPKQLRHPAFAAAINRAVTENLALHTLPLDTAFIQRLTTSPGSRTAVLIVASPLSVLEMAARICASAVLCRSMISLVLKAQRHRLRETFGAELLEIGLREVPLLYPALGDLMTEPPLPAELAEMGSEELSATFRRLGLQVLGSYLDRVEPALSRLFDLRFDAQSGLSERANIVTNMTGHQIHQLMKLLHQRMRGWKVTIG